MFWLFYTDLNENKSPDFLEYSLVIWLYIVTFCYLNTLQPITSMNLISMNSKAGEVSKASCAERASEWAVRENELADEQMAQYFTR